MLRFLLGFTMMTERKNVPYLPVPFRSGNVVTKRYEEPFIDPVGNRATITKVNFINNKGKLTEGYTLYVKWED